MADPLNTAGPQSPRYDLMRSKRALLWEGLEAAHAALGMDPPTATLTIEALEAEVKRLETRVKGGGT